MQKELLPFGPGGLAFLSLYLLSLLLVGWLGRRASTEKTLKDFYLGGKGVGMAVLFLTLYATQYSGNTLFGFSGKAYRIGFAWLTCVHFMTAIIVGYLLFAPQLYRLAKRYQFITPVDYMDHRFGHRGLNLLSSLVMTAALANYFLAQLIAMGRALQGLTTVDPQVAFVCGVILLASIMLIYETLGGFRAVAWTDAIQGVVMLLGIVGLTVLVFNLYGGLGESTRILLNGPEETRFKVMPPDALTARNWFSYILIFGLGASLYPQSIQRIYASNSSRSLKRGLTLMVLMPLVTSLFAVTMGIIGAAQLPGLEGSEADRILTLICREVQQSSVIGYWIVVILFAAILAALMSTADSCMLTISSMLTKDIYQRFINPSSDQAFLTNLGKFISWILVWALAGLAIYMNSLPGKPTLVKLLDLKFDMLVQLVPAFMIGIHSSRINGNAVFYGLITGLVVTFLFYGNEWITQTGFHKGLYGLIANLLVVIIGSFVLGKGQNEKPMDEAVGSS